METETVYGLVREKTEMKRRARMKSQRPWLLEHEQRIESRRGTAAGGWLSRAACRASSPVDHRRGLGERLPLDEGREEREAAVRAVDGHHVPGPAHRREHHALVLDHVPGDLP